MDKMKVMDPEIQETIWSLFLFLAENYTDLHFYLSTNKVFCGMSGKIQNDLVTVIAEVMGEEIKREINGAPLWLLQT